MNLNNSRMTSISFTVDDDLISESSITTHTKRQPFRGLKPFAKHYGISNDTISNNQECPLPNKQNRDILQRAKMDAFKQLNDQMFNPFEHKLGGNFIPRQDNLYEKQKKRQIELLKKKQEEKMSSNKNYKIVFNNERKSKNTTLQRAGQNVLEDGAPISEFYNKKFKKMDNIDEEEDSEGEDKEKKKVNNFVNEGRKKLLSQDGQKKENIQENNSFTFAKRNSQNGIKYQGRKKSEEKEKKPVVRTPPPQPIKKKEQIQEKKVREVKTEKKIPEPRQSKPKNQPPPSRKPNIPKAPKKTDGKKKYSEVYDGPDRNLVEQLERELTECPSISFDDIAELDTAKNLLQEAVLLPRLMPQFFQGIRRATKGILLFGPPGTGKTLLAKAIAKDNIFLNVSASSLASKWKGQSQKMVRLLFEIAKYHSPSVIFFDEIDAICSKRSQNQHESARKVKTELLVQMDGAGTNDKQVFVLAATNRPWDLDEALRRRLEKRIYIPLPGKVGRKKMFEINLKDIKISEKINWEKIIENTKGCSGADICNVCRDAAYMPMRRKLTQLGGIQKLQELSKTDISIVDEEITEKDLSDAAQKIKPSVGKDDLKRYEAWMAEFGSS